MSVFTVEGNRVRFSVHAMTLPPFREIWERDKSENKGMAILEGSYIEFMLSYAKTNVYKGYGPERRELEITSALFPDNPKWEPDELVQKAMSAYKKYQLEGSLSMRFYESNRGLLEKMISYYEDEIDLSERTKTGQPVFKPKDVLDAVSKMEDALKAMESSIERVREELYEASKTTKNREINPFETGDLVV